MFYIKFNTTCTVCDISQTQYTCILFWVLNTIYLNAWVRSERPKYVPWVEGLKNVVFGGKYLSILKGAQANSPIYVVLFLKAYSKL
jgi:hypothetical protein